MSRTYISRTVGALIVAFGLMIGLFTQYATAQVAMNTPESQIQASTDATDSSKGSVSAPSSSAQVGTAAACGWSAPYYRHCGGERWILIRVEFSYGWHGTADTWVTWGYTDLAWQYRNHAGSITSAYCVLRC